MSRAAHPVTEALKVVAAAHLHRPAEVFSVGNDAFEVTIMLEQPEPNLPIVASRRFDAPGAGTANQIAAYSAAKNHYFAGALITVVGHGLALSKHHGRPCLRLQSVGQILQLELPPKTEDAEPSDAHQPQEAQLELAAPSL